MLTQFRKNRNAQKGQVVVEYVLLLTIAVGIAALLVSLLVSRNEDKPGVLTGKWHELMTVIGEDIPDKK